MRAGLAFIGWMALTLAAGAIGGLAARGAPQFYALLAKPSWAPPAGWFGPVWSVLYIAMGIAAWLAWRARARRGALALFVVQLAVNAVWSWLFFAWRQGGLAFADIVVLWVLVAATAIAFFRASVTAGLLLVPYLAWVTFAAALTWSVWRANAGLLL